MTKSKTFDFTVLRPVNVRVFYYAGDCVVKVDDTLYDGFSYKAASEQEAHLFASMLHERINLNPTVDIGEVIMSFADEDEDEDENEDD